MSCNTLTNVRQDLVKKGFVGDKNSVNESNYTELEALLKTWQAYAGRKYGFTENLFTLKFKNAPDATATGTVNLYSLVFNKAAFEKLDVIVEDYKTEESIKEAEQEAEAGRINALNRINNEAGQNINDEGNLFDTVEDVSDSLIASSQTTNVVPLSYEDYIKHKQTLLKKVTKTVTKLYNERTVHNNNALSAKISKFNKIKSDLEDDLEQYTNTPDKFELIRKFFDKDIALINSLLESTDLNNVFLAKDLLEYLKKTRKNVSKKDDVTQDLFGLKSGESFDAQTDNLRRHIETHLTDLENDLDTVIDNAFLKLLEKNENSLLKLYPGKTLEEVKDKLLENMQDVSFLESFVFTSGQNLVTENNLIENITVIEYIKKRHAERGKINPLLTAIDSTIAGAEEELNNQNKFFTYKGKKFYDYTWMYRKENGLGIPELVSKFSKHWERTINSMQKKFTSDFKLASDERDFAKMEQLLTDKFELLDSNVEFIDPTLLHDIHISPLYDNFKGGNTQQAEAYKQEIISKIGNEEYEVLVQNQRDLIDKYMDKYNAFVTTKLVMEDVQTFDELTDINKDNINNYDQKNNPVNFIKTYKAGLGNMVVITQGTQNNAKPAYLTYNTFIPKRVNSLGMQNNFYDSQFENFENNAPLHNLWKASRAGILKINENFVDSNMKLNHYSILDFQKGITQQVINKSNKDFLVEGLLKYTNLLGFWKNIFSDKSRITSKEDVVALSHEIKTVESQIQADFGLLKTEISNILGNTLLPKTKISWKGLSQKQKNDIIKVTGAINEYDFIDKVGGNDTFTTPSLKIFSQIKIMQQQSLNLPIMLKGLLELSADHKAKTESKDETNIYRLNSGKIKVARNTAFQTQGKDRENEIKRQDFFYDQVILNKNEKKHFWNGSKELIDLMNKQDVNVLNITKLYYKNFNKEEKIIYNSAIKSLSRIENDLLTATGTRKEELLQEKANIESRLGILGKDYMVSALWDNVVNKLRVKVGLGFNALAALNNYRQGFIAALTRDGEFWKKGNIYKIQHTVDLKWTNRKIVPSFQREYDITKLFIDKLNIVETGTNELQKAEAEIKNRANWTQPNYLTEKVENRNQVKGILCMAMDLFIKDVNGVEHDFHNGDNFVAYTIENGVLKLKPEFDTPANREHFIDTTSEDIGNWKLDVENMNNSMNGDYTKYGVTRIKGSLITKPLATFKTWLPRYLSSRWRYKQKNILTGEEETGYLLASLLNKRTSVAAGVILGVTAGLGALTISPILAGISLGGIALGAGYAKYASNKSSTALLGVNQTEPIAIMQQLLYVLKLSMSPKAYLEMPVNTVVGKELIKPISLGPLTEQEAKDIRLLSRNMQTILLVALVKLSMAAMLGDGEEDVPKGKEGSLQRANFDAQQKAKAENKEVYNFFENMWTQTISETTLAVDPMALYSSGTEGGVESQIKAMNKLSKAVLSPFDEVQKGPRQGQNKLGNAVRAMFVPSLFRGIGQDTYRFGFENSMLTEWDKTEITDGLFDSDYKEDKKANTEKRNEIRQDFIEDYEKDNDVDFNELTSSEQDKIKREAKKQANLESGNPDIENYDEDQDLIEQ